MGVLAGISRVPGNTVQRSAVWSRAPGARGVFPFGFGRQAVPIAVLPGVEALQKLLNVVPRHSLHGPVRETFEVAGIGAHHRFPHGLRDLVLSDLESPGDAHAVRGSLSVV